MIELKNIQVEFSRDGASATAAVDDVSLTILEGEVFGIIGSSGAGKSTLVRTINLLQKPTSGEDVYKRQAVQSAVADAITNAGGNPKDFRLGAATPSGGAAQTADVDVALMGAGTAGLVAATRLLEAGKTVVLFEKQDIAGGSMPMTYSGVAAAESQLQANYALGRADDNQMCIRDSSTPGPCTPAAAPP